MRPRVVAVDRDTWRRAALHIEQEAVIAGRWPIIESIHGSKVSPDRRIFQAQYTTLLRIGLSGAWVVLNYSVSAGFQTQKYRLVHGVNGSRVCRVTYDIAS